MLAYARRNLVEVRNGIQSMPKDAFKYLVEIPLLLAEATLDVLERGHGKLSRFQVLEIVKQAG